MYSAVKTPRLYELIVEQIQALIVSGELKAGDRLPSERELGEQFGVSRTAVREAIKALHEKGLLSVQVGRGTFVANITDSTTGMVRDSLSLMMDGQAGLDDLIQVRELLEPEIAALAAREATPADITALQAAVDQMEVAVDQADIFIEADLEFHRILATATGNRLIPILISPVMGLLREQRKRIFQVRGGAERGQYHHKRILQAVREANVEGARQAMTEHMKQVQADSEHARDHDAQA